MESRLVSYEYSIFYLPVVRSSPSRDRPIGQMHRRQKFQSRRPLIVLLLRMLVRRLCVLVAFLARNQRTPCVYRNSCICCAQGFEFLIQQFEAVKNAAAYISLCAVLAWFGRCHWQVPIASLDQDSAVCTQLASSAWFAKGNTLVFFWRLQLCKPRLYSFKGHMLAPWYWCVRCTLHVYCMCKLALTCTTDLVYKTLETGQTLFQKGRKKGGRGRCMHGIRVLQFSILLDVLDE